MKETQNSKVKKKKPGETPARPFPQGLGGRCRAASRGGRQQPQGAWGRRGGPRRPARWARRDSEDPAPSRLSWGRCRPPPRAEHARRGSGALRGHRPGARPRCPRSPQTPTAAPPAAPAGNATAPSEGAELPRARTGDAHCRPPVCPRGAPGSSRVTGRRGSFPASESIQGAREGVAPSAPSLGAARAPAHAALPSGRRPQPCSEQGCPRQRFARPPWSPDGTRAG